MSGHGNNFAAVANDRNGSKAVIGAAATTTVSMPVMDKQDLLDRIKSLWPDAIMLGPDSGQDALNNIYWPIEEKLEAVGDEWLKLSAWAFHQALWSLAKTKADGGSVALRADDVTLDAFDHWMRENLSDETWAKVRHEYDASFD